MSNEIGENAMELRVFKSVDASGRDCFVSFSEAEAQACPELLTDSSVRDSHVASVTSERHECSVSSESRQDAQAENEPSTQVP